MQPNWSQIPLATLPKLKKHFRYYPKYNYSILFFRFTRSISQWTTTATQQSFNPLLPFIYTIYTIQYYNFLYYNSGLHSKITHQYYLSTYFLQKCYQYYYQAPLTYFTKDPWTIMKTILHKFSTLEIYTSFTQILYYIYQTSIYLLLQQSLIYL